MTAEKIELKDVLKLLPEKISLIYVDYRDNLDEHHDLLQRCLSEGNFDELYEKADEWYMESEWQGIDYIKKELLKDLQSEFEIDEDEAEDIIEKFDDNIRDEIYERRDDDVLSDLISNTSAPIMHYDTGYEMESDSWKWTEKEVYKEMQSIKKFLGIRTKKHNEAIEMMIRQATYGGNLLIYFKGDIEEFMKIDDSIKSIEFSDAWIGITDHCNGSGDITQLSGVSFKIPFSIQNVFYEESIKYNWTYAIAGMCSDWCDSTSYEFLKESKREVKLSSTNAYLEQEKKYNETFKNGGCTTGDMDYNRHRNTYYENNYPCGNKCKDCMTFWVD